MKLDYGFVVPLSLCLIMWVLRYVAYQANNNCTKNMEIGSERDPVLIFLSKL